jgi:pyruvate/2-oxoglutarate/acetoin dehydrogenase E1 component
MPRGALCAYQVVPYSEPMEAYVLPDEDKIISAVREVLGLTAPR